MRMIFGRVLTTLAAVLSLATPPAEAAPLAKVAPTPRRLAVVVGANAASPGRRPLRFAQEDARAVADVLTELGGFATADVTVLLDPAPTAVLAALDAALAQAKRAAGEAIVLFYYSGHADPQALYPGGQKLSLAGVRERLGDLRAKVRVGIIDACRGGGWTGAKGLTAADPFSVDVPEELYTAGSVLISSSSGLESAHESEALGGSFFTHHWNAALRGAADQNVDGVVTMSEAFEYAQRLTVRDTALIADAPQHPSFLVKLAGREDLVLASIDRKRALLELTQRRGPLQLLHLPSGRLLLELPGGRRTARLMVPEGRYLVRRRTEQGTFMSEVEISLRETTTVDEATLRLTPIEYLATKGEAPALEPSTIAPSAMDLQMALGVRHAPVIDPGLRITADQSGAAVLLRFSYGLTERWQLVAPLALAYGGGDRERGPEWIPWLGLPVVGGTQSPTDGTVLTGLLGAGLDLRFRFGPRVSLNVSGNSVGAFQWASHDVDRCSVSRAPCLPARANRRPPDSWTGQVTLGISYALSEHVAFNFGGAVNQNLLVDGKAPPSGLADTQGLVLSLGSVQRRGLRALPLIRVYLTDSLSLDAIVVVSYLVAKKSFADTYLGGVTWTWR